MAIGPTDVRDLEKDKFREDSSGRRAVAVVNTDGSAIGGAGTGASADQVQGTAADNAAAVGNPVQTGGVYNSSAPTYANGDIAASQADVNGNTKVTLATQIAGEDLTNDVLKSEQRFSYLNIVAGQATTVVKAGAGFLHAITFNGPATATNTTNVYDHASGAGTIIATPLATAIVSPVTLIFDVSFSTGLTIITATANGANMTVSYR